MSSDAVPTWLEVSAAPPSFMSYTRQSISDASTVMYLLSLHSMHRGAWCCITGTNKVRAPTLDRLQQQRGLDSDEGGTGTLHEEVSSLASCSSPRTSCFISRHTMRSTDVQSRELSLGQPLVQSPGIVSSIAVGGSRSQVHHADEGTNVNVSINNPYVATSRRQ